MASFMLLADRTSCTAASSLPCWGRERERARERIEELERSNRILRSGWRTLARSSRRRTDELDAPKKDPELLFSLQLRGLNISSEERVLEDPARAAGQAAPPAMPTASPAVAAAPTPAATSQRSSNLGGRQGCCSFSQAPQVPKRSAHALGATATLSTLQLLRAQEALHITGPAYDLRRRLRLPGRAVCRVLGQLRAEGLQGCEPHGPSAYEVRWRAVCSAAQTVRDGGRPLPVAGQGAGLGFLPGHPQQSGVRRTLGTSCGSRPRDAEACAAGAGGWGPCWAAQNRPGRSGL